MRFKNMSGGVLKASRYETEYKEAEKLFSLRFGKETLFFPGFFSTKAIAYAELCSAYLETEFVECRTSELPAEYNVYRLFFQDKAERVIKRSVDSRVKAERILAKLLQKAPHVELLSERKI